MLTFLGVANGCMYLFVNLSLSVSTNIGALAIANQLSAPIGVLFGILFLGERVTPLRAAGMALAFAGVSMLMFDPAIAHEVRGLALMVAAAACWALTSLCQRQLAGVPVKTMMAWTGLAGTAVLLPAALIAEPDMMVHIGRIQPLTTASLIFSVLGSTLLAQSGMAWLLARHDLSVIMPLTLVSPMVSVVAAALFFGTHLTPTMILCGLVTLAGVGLVLFAAPRPLPPSDA